jgi:hypothetical protein
MQGDILPAAALPASLSRMRILPIALALLLAGCHPFDQRDVARWLGGRPAAPNQADLAETNLPPLPLVTVRFDQPGTDITAVLTEAAQAAMERKETVTFDVVTPLPTAAPRAVQDEFVSQGADDARMVADVLATAGVPPERLHLGLRGDPGNPVREVRVYVH